MVYNLNVQKKRYFLVVMCLFSLACSLSGLLPGLEDPAETPTMTNTTLPSSTPLPTATPTPLPTPTLLPGLRIASGEKALFYGDWDSAEQAFQQALAASSDIDLQNAASFGLAKLTYLSGDQYDALNLLRDWMDRYPDTPQQAYASFYLGNIYDELGRYGEAADAYLKYLALRPGILDSFILEKRADSLFAAGDFSGAQADYQASLQSPRLDSSLLLEIKIARTYAILGDFDSALQLYDSIYARSGSALIKAQVDLLKGQVLLSLGQYDLGYAAYLDAVVNYPQVYDSYTALVEIVNAGYPVDELNRGIVDYYAGQYWVALAAFTRYLENSPVDPAAALYYQGLTLRALDDVTSAIQNWDSVIIYYPASSYWDDAYEEKAYTQWAYLDQYVEAENALVSFVASAPGHARAAEFLFDAAQIAERSGDMAEAARLWLRTASEYPTSGYGYRALFQAGIASYRAGNFPKARDYFQWSIDFAANNTEYSAALLWIGKSFQASSDQASAQKSWEEAAALDPTGYYSERSRELISGKAPFSPLQQIDLGRDEGAEQAEAENWLRATFALPADQDFSWPGDLVNDSGFQRGQEYWRLGLFTEASTEFDALRLTLQSDPLRSYRLARYLTELGAYRPALLAARQVLTIAGMDDAATLTAPKLFNHIRFGTYYADLVIPIAQQDNFYPLFVWSVMRQESFFDRSIRSSAGARGLMQIMPSTGEDIANRKGWPQDFTIADLDRPYVSIRLGIDYLADQRDAMDGNLYAALAAYNAGSGNASEWKRLAGDDPDLLLEIIRWKEPQGYIKGIYEMYTIYCRIYGINP